MMFIFGREIIPFYGQTTQQLRLVNCSNLSRSKTITIVIHIDYSDLYHKPYSTATFNATERYLEGTRPVEMATIAIFLWDFQDNWIGELGNSLIDHHQYMFFSQHT